MIYVIGKPTECAPEYQPGDWQQFLSWIAMLGHFEFDIETTVSNWWCDKKLITMQFGWTDTQWVLQWSELTEKQKEYVKGVLESTIKKKLIHNAMFECVVCLFHSIRVVNVVDTMLQEQVIYGGEPGVGYGLDDTCQRRLGIVLDKSQQTAFGDNILTPEKIVYAAQDVRHLNYIHQQQLVDFKRTADSNNPYGLKRVADLENRAVLGFAEKVYHGMEMDADWWRGLQDEAEPLVAEAHRKLTEWINQEPFYSKALELGYISTEDKLLVNWKSPKQKQLIFSYLFPDIPGTSRAVCKKYLGQNLVAVSTKYQWLPWYIDGDISELERELLTYHKQWLIDTQLLVPAEVCTINWSSQQQVLPIMNTVEPKMKDLSEESRGKCSHPILVDYESYKETLKLISAFGEDFLQKYIEPDGKVRTSFNQVLTTGRISSHRPNMQQIPAKETVGNKYRNAFIAPAGWVYVSSDMVSQELIVIAYLSKDPVWMEALAKGEDLHSIAAEMVYGQKWKNATESMCQYYYAHTDKQGIYHSLYSKLKCSCKKHKDMRTGVKTINFGLAYGMSHFKLAGTLRISVSEAKQMIEDYFRAFPGISKLLEYLGQFGVENGYIQTIYPFYRRRFFPYWKWYRDKADEHLSGMRYHSQLGEVQRASMNMPIQGSSADMMKVAVCMVYNYIHNNQLEDRVRMVMQVHDQLDTICREDYSEEWKLKLTELMEAAAKVIIPTGILKAETQITIRWSK